MKNLHLLELFSRSFFVPCAPFSTLGGSGRTVPAGPTSIENGAHGTEKLLLKNSSK